MVCGPKGPPALAPPAVAVIGHGGRDANGVVLISPDNIMATDELADDICRSRRDSVHACDSSYASMAPKNYDSAAADGATAGALPFEDDRRGGSSGSGGGGGGVPQAGAAATAGASSCDEMGFKSLAMVANGGGDDTRVSVSLTDEEIARPQGERPLEVQ